MKDSSRENEYIWLKLFICLPNLKQEELTLKINMKCVSNIYHATCCNGYINAYNELNAQFLLNQISYFIYNPILYVATNPSHLFFSANCSTGGKLKVNLVFVLSSLSLSVLPPRHAQVHWKVTFSFLIPSWHKWWASCHSANVQY